jgi:hypothetical protein
LPPPVVLALLIPKCMSTVHTHDVLLTLFSSLPPSHNFPPKSMYLHNWSFSGTKPGHSSLISYWLTLVLWESQGELTFGCSVPFYFCIIQHFCKPHALYAACFLLVSCLT